jgi:hypothetical protein
MPSGGSSVLGLTTEPSRGVSRTLARAAAGCRVTELSLQVLVELVIEGAPRWQTGEDGRWASGAGARHGGCLFHGPLTTLVHLRHGSPRMC